MKTNYQWNPINLILVLITFIIALLIFFYFYNASSDKSVQQIKTNNLLKSTEIIELKSRIEQLETELAVNQNALANHLSKTTNKTEKENFIDISKYNHEQPYKPDESTIEKMDKAITKEAYWTARSENYTLDPLSYLGLNNAQQRFFDDSLYNEPIDTEWAFEMEEKVRSSISQLPIPTESVDVECGSTFCKIKTRFKLPNNNTESVIPRVSDNVWRSFESRITSGKSVEMDLSFENQGETEVATYYIARGPDYLLPFLPN